MLFGYWVRMTYGFKFECSCMYPCFQCEVIEFLRVAIFGGDVKAVDVKMYTGRWLGYRSYVCIE